jgi:Ni/Fe-hydrogenase subunit HybB-like protein
MAAAVETNLQPRYIDVDRQVQRAMAPGGLTYWMWVLLCAFLTALGIGFWTNQVYKGLGVTGLTEPTMWAPYITNFVFWVGIAHSGTLISAILFLFRVRWRTAIYRCAETMTVFAVATAGLFPLIHLGRLWFFYFVVPYPNERYLQPDFRSPLVWDFFAIGTYLTISTVFRFTGLIPDCANARELATGWRKILYSIFSFGWQGTDRQWRNFQMVYLLLAGFATPLVLSVHSVVSWDFAMTQLPGWHSTIFAPYFVAGAIFSGCALVLTLIIPIRKFWRLEEMVTIWHLDNLAKIVLFTSLIITYSYTVESFMVWYSQDPLEMTTFNQRYFGPQGYFFWIMVLCNCVIPLLLFSPRVRTNTVWLFIISIFVNIGMWLERYVIVVTSLHSDFLPSSWGMYHGTFWDYATYYGTLGLFLSLMFLFIRFLPVISIAEMRELVHETQQEQERRAEPGSAAAGGATS